MNLNDKQYIGTLASAKDLEGSNFRENVFVNTQAYIQYIVKSKTLPIMSQSLFTGYMSCFDENCNIKDDSYQVDDIRIADFEQQLKDQFIIFTYRVKEGKYYNVSSAYLLPRSSSLSLDTMFHAVPIFSSYNDIELQKWENSNKCRLFRDYSTYEEFTERIRSGKSLGNIYGYDFSISAPSFVIWKGINGELFAVGYINEFRLNSLGAVILESYNLFHINLSDYESFFVFDTYINPTLMFVPQEIYTRIENRILQESSSNRNETPIQTDKIENNEIQPEIITQPSSEQLNIISTEKKDDNLILQCMQYHSQKMNLFYTVDDLINFHTAVKCSNLVILSGISGTGKSALVDVYAKALGITAKDDRMLFVPVRPSWNDDSDLLGYVDLVHMVYRASDTGFVNLLVEANKQENKNKLYLVCFDEMNLARVEHYFSQFLSLLEKPVSQRELRLYDDQYIGRLYNSSEYPSYITIGDNIKFIGTVNIDESTFHFSDKVLDRANVISLDILDYSKPWSNISFAALSSIIWNTDEYTDILNKHTVNMEIRKFLWELHTILYKTSNKLGIGLRVVKHIELYLNNLPTGNLSMTINKGLDYQLSQRVLTKVRGSESQLGSLFHIDSEDGLLKVLEKYSDLSDFYKSKSIVNQKRKELDSYGYCI